MGVCTCTCMYVCMHVRMCVRVYVWKVMLLDATKNNIKEHVCAPVHSLTLKTFSGEINPNPEKVA